MFNHGSTKKEKAGFQREKKECIDDQAWEMDTTAETLDGFLSFVWALPESNYYFP